MTSKKNTQHLENSFFLYTFASNFLHQFKNAYKHRKGLMHKHYDIFLSYRREDGRDFARMLKESLEVRGYRVVFDLDELKDGAFDKTIFDAIHEAPIFVFLMTTHCLDRTATQDDWVRQELEYAIMHNKEIIPVVPDKQFEGYPKHVPVHLKNALKRTQYSVIDTNQLYQASINQIDEERLRPILQRSAWRWIKWCILSLTILIIAGCATYYMLYQYMPKQYVKQSELYFKGDSISQPDTLKALDYLLKADQRGYADAIMHLGTFYAQPTSFQDIDKAFFFLQHGSELGHAQSQRELGHLYTTHRFNHRMDCEKGFYWLSKAYEAGDTMAIAYLGECYQAGWGTVKDTRKALELYKQGSDLGDTHALFCLGSFLYFGLETTKDEGLGAFYLMKAALNGDSVAKQILGQDNHWVFFPAVDSVSNNNLQITAIKLNQDSITFMMDFQCTNSLLNHHFCIEHTTCLQGTDAQWPIVKAYGCCCAPEVDTIPMGTKKSFTLVFPATEEGKPIDLTHKLNLIINSNLSLKGISINPILNSYKVGSIN